MYKNFSSVQAQLLLSITILISGLAFFETTAVNVAVPAIQKEFSATISLMQWAINSYNLMLGVFILTMGSLSDRFGSRQLLLTGLGLFTLGSALCGSATDIWMLIFARVVQGIGGAMIIPQSITIINNSFERSIRGKALGIWGAASGLMTIAGPFFSGAIVDTSRWENIFLLLVPLGLVTIILVYKIIPFSKPTNSTEIDLNSVLLLSAGLFGISYGLIQASSQDWKDPIIISAVIAGCILLTMFVMRQNRIQSPLIAHDVLSHNVVLANIYTVLLYGVISSLAFFGVIFFQEVAGYSATLSGLALMPVSIIIAVMAIYSGSIADKYGSKKPMIIGAAIVTAGLLSLLLRVTEEAHYITEIFPGMMLIGVGFGLFVPSLTKAALDVPQNHSGTASGINNSLSRLAGLLGIAILGAVLSSSFYHILRGELKHLNLSETTYKAISEQSSKLMQIDISGFTPVVQTELRSNMKHAFLQAYKIQLLICALLASGGILTASMLKKSK